MKSISFLLSILVLSSFHLSAEEKLADDPTKIVTQFGASYSDELRVSGSISLDPVRKINASASANGDEWRIGGSWLFDIGIVNFNFGKQSYDQSAEKKSYSIGTFMPLSYLGIEPAGWQIFAMGGYSHTEGDIACNIEQRPCVSTEIPGPDGWVLVPNSSNGGYLGAFALKSLSDKWNIMTAGAYSIGSNDYSGYFAAAGVSYMIDKRQKINLFGSVENSDYGSDQSLGLSYTYQFN